MIKSNVNYAKVMQKQLENIKNDIKPRLLLHVCCGPCFTIPFIELEPYFDITIYYDNSNIYPKSEYDRRLDELKKYIGERNYKLDVIIPPYDNDLFNEDLLPFKDLPEGHERCRICFQKRLSSLFKYASENGFDYCSTALTISRYKSSKDVNEIAEKIAENYPEVKWLFADFKKRNGYEKSLLICREYDLYFQEYCGCIFSYKKWSKKQKRDDF
ncbi:MAG: epoxyqueuosine reductase QueH [Erysipelotrichaceae bacterium]|jgi:predicted adenine nucleotide alpha hydrolase (AANH) superfamily ATPase|nr:epoxyqueuosine reductase QueH [Erysipelotrichaceae bacterium]